MKPLSFAEACEAVGNLQGEASQAAMSSLADSMAQAVDQVEVEPFDPLQCIADDASRCAYHGRPVVRGHRVCLVAVDPEVPCAVAPR